jgi:hypothetical protein
LIAIDIATDEDEGSLHSMMKKKRKKSKKKQDK